MTANPQLDYTMTQEIAGFNARKEPDYSDEYAGSFAVVKGRARVGDYIRFTKRVVGGRNKLTFGRVTAIIEREYNEVTWEDITIVDYRSCRRPKAWEQYRSTGLYDDR